MKIQLLLVGIIILLGLILGIVVLNYNETLNSKESLYENYDVEKVIEAFEEKYSEQEITKFPDSNGIPYKYSVKNGPTDIELILEKDRILLKAWKDDQALCIISNPLPRDIFDNCPLKW